MTILVGANSLEDGKARLRFEVVDSGIGISPTATERIFQRFTQADATILDRYGGTGLGLAIAKQLVEGMGGEIGVESEVGRGSAFWFEVPTTARPNATSASSTDDIYLLSPDESLRDLIARAGANVQVLSDAAALDRALAAARGAHRPSVALIDARRPLPESEAVVQSVFKRIADRDVTLVGLLNGDEASRKPEILGFFATTVAENPDEAEIGRICALAAAGRREQTDAATKPARQVRAPLDVLVAEDNKTNQLVIRKILERAGHRWTIVSDGQAALEKLNEKRFDLAFMDINMPVINGVDAAKLYRFSAPDHERTPIVALTADATPEARQRCLDAGMAACIVKPIEPSQLIAWLDDFASTLGGAPVPVEELRNSVDDPIEAAPIDDRAIAELKSLGGEDFVSEIVDQFLGDAADVLHNLHRAVADGDVQRFRDEAHALRSCAANVGAQKVYKLCLEWRSIDARELAIEGELRIKRLEREFERARDALACFCRSEDNS